MTITAAQFNKQAVQERSSELTRKDYKSAIGASLGWAGIAGAAVAFAPGLPLMAMGALGISALELGMAVAARRRLGGVNQRLG